MTSKTPKTTSSQTPASDLDQRVSELEAKITLQDDVIETLNQTILNQWALIDRHTCQIEALTDRLQQAEQREIGSGDEKPPHY